VIGEVVSWFTIGVRVDISNGPDVDVKRLVKRNVSVIKCRLG
jgi:hypothetical protein